MSVARGKTQKQKTYDRGLWAESLAALYLMARGYKILRRRYKTPHGEIDLIARKGATVCFIEVKAHASESASLEAVNARTQARIENAALAFLAENPELLQGDMRFDVVAVVSPVRIVHLDNAWEARS